MPSLRFTSANQDMRQAYYAEALKLAMVYGLEELGLYSMYTSSGEYEPEIKQALEAAGFQEAVRQRDNVFRDGCLWDRVFMEILQEDWKIQQRRGASMNNPVLTGQLVRLISIDLEEDLKLFEEWNYG